jgi:hypothetical protein
VREERFYRAIIKSGGDRGAEAAFNLGHVLERHGRIRQARAAYQVAIDSGHQEWGLPQRSASGSSLLTGETSKPRGLRGSMRSIPGIPGTLRRPR